MLCHVSIYQQQQQTRVEELSNENNVGNGCQLLRVGVFSDPFYTCDDENL
tara:strand:- start:622 stop:771 length:150 start_codon:yes stop_codon:yes gene_type:complete